MIAKINFPRLTAILAIPCALAGCEPRQQPAPSSESMGAPSRRNNGYSLLHQLLDEQKDVSMLHFIKREDSEVKNLMKRIAKASGADAELLEAFAKRDATIRLNDLGLPPGETATREAIAATKKKELLSLTGDAFELTLLLTQTEALSYAQHLAKVTSENEPQPERAEALGGVSEEMRKLYQDVFVILLSKTDLSAASHTSPRK